MRDWGPTRMGGKRQFGLGACYVFAALPA